MTSILPLDSVATEPPAAPTRAPGPSGGGRFERLLAARRRAVDERAVDERAVDERAVASDAPEPAEAIRPSDIDAQRATSRVAVQTEESTTGAAALAQQPDAIAQAAMLVAAPAATAPVIATPATPDVAPPAVAGSTTTEPIVAVGPVAPAPPSAAASAPAILAPPASAEAPAPPEVGAADVVPVDSTPIDASSSTATATATTASDVAPASSTPAAAAGAPPPAALVDAPARSIDAPAHSATDAASAAAPGDMASGAPVHDDGAARSDGEPSQPSGVDAGAPAPAHRADATADAAPTQVPVTTAPTATGSPDVALPTTTAPVARSEALARALDAATNADNPHRVLSRLAVELDDATRVAVRVHGQSVRIDVLEDGHDRLDRSWRRDVADGIRQHGLEWQRQEADANDGRDRRRDEPEPTLARDGAVRIGRRFAIDLDTFPGSEP